MKLFVYGTLKSSHPRNFYLEDSIFLKNVKTAKKYRLYKQWFVNYPFMALNSNGAAIEGELWEVSENVIKDLDFIEGKNFKRVLVELEDGTEVFGYLIIDKPFPYSDIGTKW